jgi:hypothetical protein
VQVGISPDVIAHANAVATAVDQEERQTSSRPPSLTEIRDARLYELAHKISCIAQARRYNAAVALDVGRQMAQLKREAVELLAVFGNSEAPMEVDG